MLIEIIISILVLLTAVPIGLWLEKVTRDEKYFRKIFSKIVIVLSILLVILVLVLSLTVEQKLSFIFTLVYFDIICFISLVRS